MLTFADVLIDQVDQVEFGGDLQQGGLHSLHGSPPGHSIHAAVRVPALCPALFDIFPNVQYYTHSVWVNLHMETACASVSHCRFADNEGYSDGFRWLIFTKNHLKRLKWDKKRRAEF